MKTALRLLGLALVLSTTTAQAEKPDISTIEKMVAKMEKNGDDYSVTVKPEYEDVLKKKPIETSFLLMVYVLEKNNFAKKHGNCEVVFKGLTVTFKFTFSDGKTPPQRPPIKA